MAIDGDGFFVVQGQTQQFTRDGSFSLNQNDQLVTTGGDFVQGFGVDANGNVNAGQTQNIQIPLGSLTKVAKATDQPRRSREISTPTELVASGASDLQSSLEVEDSTNAVAVHPRSQHLASLLTNLQDQPPAETPTFVAGDTLTLDGKRGGRDLPPLTLTPSLGSFRPCRRPAKFLQPGPAGSIRRSPPTACPPTTTPGTTVHARSERIPDGYLQHHRHHRKHRHGQRAPQLAGTGFTSTNPNMAAGISPSPISRPTPAGESVFTSFVGYDSLGTPLTVNVTATLESKTATGTTWRFYATASPDEHRRQCPDLHRRPDAATSPRRDAR